MQRFILKQIWDRLRASYWFAPVVMGAAAFLLAQAAVQLDANLPDELLEDLWLVYSGDVEEAQRLLGGLAATILGIAGIVFSLLTVPLSVAAGQFGSRLLRLYLRDTTLQVVLGLFVAAFIYLVTVAAAISRPDASTDSPQVATSLGLLLSIATFGSIIVLIHHIATILQAPNVVARAGAELRHVVTSSIEATERQPSEGPVIAARTMEALAAEQGYPIYAEGVGYIQAISPLRILLVANQNDLVVRFIRKPGAFLEPGELIALVWPPGRVNQRIAERIQRAYILGWQRTPTQDLEYAVNQLVEIGVRAMSPAINDPFTTMTCLDHLALGLGYFLERAPRDNYYYDRQGKLRVIYDAVSFAELAESAFNMLRRAGRENAEVLLRALEAIETIARKARSRSHIAELRRHIHLVDLENEASSAIDWDRDRVRQRCAALDKQLSAMQLPAEPET